MYDGHGRPTLFKYQVEGSNALLSFLRQDSRAALLADPPGAGKSAQAIAVMKELRAERTLVLCPKSLKLNWAREIEMWTGERAVQILRKSTDAIDPTAKVVISNYHLACREPLLSALTRERWAFLCMDEAHCLRSPSSQMSRTCFVPLWASATYRLLMTGTPVPNGRAVEAWPMFSRLAPDLFGRWEPYKSRYCIPEETPWGIAYPRSKNLDELGRIARERFMVRRSREEVLGQLPPLVRQHVPLDIPALEVQETQEGLDISAVVEAVLAGVPLRSDPISTARRKLGILKAPLAAEFIRDQLEEVESVVVFCHHREVFQTLFEALEDLGVVRVSGKTPTDERQAAVDAFQGGRARVFLGSLTAANTGITLTRSQAVIFVEADWVPTTNEQAEGRIHRVTQTDITRAIYLVAANSLDEAVVRSVVRKQRNIERVMQDA